MIGVTGNDVYFMQLFFLICGFLMGFIYYHFKFGKGLIYTDLMNTKYSKSEIKKNFVRKELKNLKKVI